MSKTRFTFPDGTPVDRSKCIGASDIGALVLPNKWNTPHELWLDKTGRKTREETLAMRRGKFLERFILREFRPRAIAQGFPIKHLKANRLSFRHPRYEWATATPDAFCECWDERCTVETKDCNDYMAEEFGKPGSDECPTNYILQVAWQMMVCHVRLGFLCVLLSNRDCAVYRFDARDEHTDLADLMKRALSLAGAWRNQYLLPDMPPPITGYEPDTRFVKETYSYDDGSIIAAEQEIAERCRLLVDLRHAEAEAALKAQEQINVIRTYMGEASKLETPLGTFSCAADKNGRRSFRLPRRIEGEAAA